MKLERVIRQVFEVTNNVHKPDGATSLAALVAEFCRHFEEGKVYHCNEDLISDVHGG